jgi:hypothetical protein
MSFGVLYSEFSQAGTSFRLKNGCGLSGGVPAGMLSTVRESTTSTRENERIFHEEAGISKRRGRRRTHLSVKEKDED